MKGALRKRRGGIPAALLLALLLVMVFSGVALAWYCFNTISSGTTVDEPLSTVYEKEFSDNMWPSGTNTWSFKIANSAPVKYSVKADWTFSAPSGVSITDFTVDDGTGATDPSTVDLSNNGYAEFSISANGTQMCRMTIKAAGDATPGKVSVSLDLSRE